MSTDAREIRLLNDLEIAILHQVDAAHTRLKAKGILTRTYTDYSLECLRSLDTERKSEILTSLKEWNAVLAVGSKEARTLKDEIHMVEAVLARKSLKLINCKWDTSDENLIIEMYNQVGVQVYRSQSFFLTSGYAVLDLSAREWFHLWERPKTILQQMGEVVNSVLEGRRTSNVVDIKPHLILEIFNEKKVEPFYPKALRIDFKNIYPIHTADEQMAGFIVTSTATVVSEGEDISKLSCI